MDSQLTIFLTGEAQRPGTPTSTLAVALVRQSARVTRVDPGSSYRQWLRTIISSDAVVYIGYDDLCGNDVVRLAMAAFSGRPLIRWWVGTDVLNCLRDESIRTFSRDLDSLVSLNIAVAPHLVDELASVGIEAIFVPSVIDVGQISPRLDKDIPHRSVLVYLPSLRARFYGADVVRQAIIANPDLEFVIVANDDDEFFAAYPNVRNVGWVGDMSSLYSEVGCLLRMTEHDGLPRMVLEALLAGKYVIYSWPLDGCWYAKEQDEVQAALRRFRQMEGPNYEGLELARRMLTPDAAAQFLARVRSAISSTSRHGSTLRVRQAISVMRLLAKRVQIRLKLYSMNFKISRKY